MAGKDSESLDPTTNPKKQRRPQSDLDALERTMLSGKPPREVEIFFAKEWKIRRRSVRKYMHKIRLRWRARSEREETPESRAAERYAIKQQLGEMFFKAMAAGDIQHALPVLRTRIEFLGLANPTKIELSGITAAPTPEQQEARIAELLAKAAGDGSGES